ncbi:MAG: VOC family protein [Bradyrhizobium sp.]|jgi:predicted enzyme related to lactoylglutathione lyase
MLGDDRRFAWYELLTTDVPAAQAFYCDVVGWGAHDASTPDLPYTSLSVGGTPLGGLMPLPQDAKDKGARPRWMGYVGVRDVDLTTDLVKRLGGSVYVPPTNSNIGRIAVIADPQTAILGLVERSVPSGKKALEMDAPGLVGWHELLATDWAKAFTYYRELFGWERAAVDLGPTETYQLFSTGGQTAGGIFTKRPVEPVPYWLYYFNVEDIDAAADRVKRAGGQIFEGPIEVPEESWIARCIDPQGAIFALQGKRSQAARAKDPAGQVGWSTSWSGITSRGRLVEKPGLKK